MKLLTEILEFITAHGVALTIVGAAVAFIWSVWQFFDIRRREFQSREFKTYHRLVKELVQPDKETGIPLLDRQIAIVYELRHFKRYREVSERILRGLKEDWSKNPTHRRLIEEIDVTLKNLEG